MSVLHKIGKFTMSLLPNKNLFIVTSALHANIGVVNMQDRVIQTIDTLENLKRKIPDALILFVDGSPHNIDEDIKKKISEYCQTIWFNTNPGSPNIVAVALHHDSLNDILVGVL